MKKFYLLLKLFLLLAVQSSWAQVLDPNDPVVVYNPSAPPVEPAWGQIGKWVKTTRLNWNTSSYKAYIYKGVQFRLKWPANYDPAKKYPIIVFFHGLGEKGTKYDNEYQLYHGGQTAMNKVDNGTYDGFLFYPQNLSGYFGPSYYDAIIELINNFFRPQLNVDPYRVFVHGLSAGGSATWDFIRYKPTLVAGLGPISAATSDLPNTLNSWKYTPIWWFQGGVDVNPPPQVARAVYNTAVAAGANIKLTEYPGQGHGVWNLAWGEPDFWSFAYRACKSNPWTLFGRTEFCPGDPVNVTIGLTPGFNAYEWRKDGNIIPGATGNTINATSYGTYDARVYNGTTWSDWSPIPVVLKEKEPTVSPTIAISGLMSNVLPTPAGSDSVVLEVPAGYTSYQWKKTTDATTLSTQQTLTVRQAGDYVVKVTEQFGCSSDFSAPFKVIPANGANGPDAVTGLIASGTSRTEVTLNWSDKPNPAYNETLFEVYRSLTAVDGYKLVAKVPADVVTYVDNNLNPNTTYYYMVRPVNNNGGATATAPASATTQVDATPPSAPGNLTVTGVSRNSVALSWTASTDDVGVDKYDIYINGLKSFTIGDQTTFLAAGLNYQQAYTFVVKARDLTGNISNASNQVNAVTKATGLNYKYYTGTWDALPNFANLTPVKTGNTPNIDITVRTQNDNFGFLWEGFINIPVSGNYTFETYSDDGSKLYIGNYSHNATALVNNDGLHGSQYREGTINLTAGVHPIAMTFFEKGGGEMMRVYWKNTAHGVTSRQQIPSEYFTEASQVSGNAPAEPTGIIVTPVSHTKLNVAWTDNSNNESGFEIYKATSENGTYSIVATVGANKTNYVDSALSPLSTFYYRVQAINQFGSSGFALTEKSGMKYDYYEAGSYLSLPDFDNVTPKKSGNVATVDITPRDRNTQFAMKFEGLIYAPTAGNYTFYTRSDAGSELYIGDYSPANRIVSNDHLSGTVEKSGVKALTAGYHKLIVTYFEATNTRTLTASYAGPGISKRTIPASALLNPYIKGTTLAAPTIPAVPSGLAATAPSASSIHLTWNENASNEDAVEIWRSTNTNSNFILIKTIGAVDSTVGTYIDTPVAANTTYFYKVKSKNEGGTSVFSNEATVVSGNTIPEVAAIESKGMRYETQLQVDVAAADADGDALTLTASNLPAFATFSDLGNGAGKFVFNPAITQQGTFANITVTAADGHGGSAARSFTLTVDDNFQPVLSPVDNVTLAEKATSSIALTAADQNGADELTWTVDGLPEFATLVPAGNTASINLEPGYTDNGTYLLKVKVSDGKGGEDSKSFNLTITDVDPNFNVKINFTEGSWQAPAPWYNTNKKPVLGDVFTGIGDNLGRTTAMTMTIMTPWQNINGGANTNNQGYVTGNNTGLYPDAVMASNWWTQSVKQTIKIAGLDTNYRYTFTFFASRNGISDNRIALYKLNETATATLNATNNQNNTVTIQNVDPTAAGEIVLDLDVAPGSVYAYISGLVIDASYDDGKAPAKAGDVKAQIIPEGVRLSWTDKAFNETGYSVQRATAQAGPYQTLLAGTGNMNDTAYTDPNIAGSTTYYYVVGSINGYGTSYSDTVAITAPNRAPGLAAIANVNMKTDSVAVINITATDDPADVITITATGLPSFANLQDAGNGTATLTLSPVDGNTGTFNVTVTAADNSGQQSSRSFSIAVADKNLNSTYVDFNRIDPSSAPWNNFNSAPFAGAAIADLKDGNGISTGMSITLVDALTGDNTNGAVTGDNSGVFPDAVMRTYYYDQSGTNKRIRLSGLSSSLKYNLIFFGGRELVQDNRNTIFSVGAQSVTLNAASNTSNTVQINGLSPDASGNIEFTVRQASGSFAAYLGAMVIQSYVDNGIPLSPDNLVTSNSTKTSLKLTWADKSSNETGFEVYRSSSRNGTYSLITTTAADVNTYTDAGLSENNTYFYKVRAKADTVFSGYTNIAVGSTIAYSVNINFNTVNPAPAPWNNTNTLPYEGQTMSNPLDNEGNPTSFTWTIIENFTGTNPAGSQTGDDSGIYPDRVMAESYYVEPGDTARMFFTGLDQSKEYAFTFFASRASGGTRIGSYSINDRTVTLDAYDNISNTATLDKISPDGNGELTLKVYVHTAYGYLNAMVISATPKENPAEQQQGGTGGALLVARSSGNGIAGAEQQLTAKAGPHAQTAVTAAALTVDNVYPNPFSTYFNLAMQIGKNNGGKVMIRLLDINGRQMLMKDLGVLPAGLFQQRFEVANNSGKGMYFLQILVDGKQVKTIKLIRN